MLALLGRSPGTALRRRYLAALVLLLLPSAAFAHHTYAMFDRTQKAKVVGDVRDLQFENPHGWLRVLVPSAQGQPILWAFELGPPGVLRRQGWAPKAVQVGDHVTVLYYPMRDGSAAGQLISVTFDDGKSLIGGPDQ